MVWSSPACWPGRSAVRAAGWGCLAGGFRSFPLGRRRGGAVAVAAGAVPELPGDACVVAGGVVAAQGLSGRAGLGGLGGSGGWCWSSADRGGVVGAGVDGPGVAAPVGRRGRWSRCRALVVGFCRRVGRPQLRLAVQHQLTLMRCRPGQEHPGGDRAATALTQHTWLRWRIL
jgi:hypothetical protein